jgi:uncharacterized radical SAM superfamily Fe-S cluster-containing enzyme
VIDGVFHRTRVHCCECQEIHEAALRVADGAVILEVGCPRGTRAARVSSDAALFRAIRRRSALPAPALESVRGFTWVNFLEITRECNCTCPVCYADARPGAGGHLPLAEVEAVARALRDQGLKAISLTGGEPTLHPELPSIIANLRRIGLDVTLISNGLRLGRDPALARRLRRSGLTYLYLQLDTLSPRVCETIRGDREVETRLRAVEHARRAGMHLGVNVTVVRDNLDEAGALLAHAAARAPGLDLVTYLPAGNTGRFLLDEGALVTREDVIRSLVRSGVVDGLTADCFWPFPRFAPLGLDLHPDCGVVLPLALDRGRLFPLERYVDVAGLFRRLAAARGPVDRRRGMLVLGGAFLRSVRPGRAGAVARMLAGLFSGRGRSSIVTVVVEQFLDRQHQDEERIERCTTCAVLRDGRRIPMCVFQHADPRRSPDTRAARAARGEP